MGKKRVCSKCGADCTDKLICPNPACKSVSPADIVLEGDYTYTCPLCGGEVLYIGATPAALECDSRECPNYKLR